MTTTNKEFHAKNGLRVGANNGIQVVDSVGNWTGNPIPSNQIQTGTTAVQNGGTGATTFTAGYLKSPGSTGAFITVTSIPGSDVTGNIAGSASGLTSTLAAASGGTGNSTYAIGDLLYASAPNALSKLAGNTSPTLKVLTQSGTGTASSAPAWTTFDKAAIGLGNVENTALSTWTGSTNVTTVGNITSGTWNGTVVAIEKGGTGATSATSALNNLLPTSGGVGYVLKSNGASSYYWAQETGAQTLSGTTLSTTRGTVQIATAGQTVFVAPTYETGKGQLRVYRNGLRDFNITESNATSFSLVQAAQAGDEIEVEVDKAVAYDFQAVLISFPSNTGNIAASNVRDAIIELDNEKQPNISTTDDTTTNGTLYPLFVSGSGNKLTSQKISTTKLTFNPSSGVLSATSCNSLSDSRLKSNVVTIENATETINKLNGVSFKWNENGKKSYGVIAQELEKVLPDLIENGDYKTVNYSGLFGFLIQGFKELDARIKALEAK